MDGSTSSHASRADAAATEDPIGALDRRLHPRYVLSLSITLEGENNFYAGLSENISEAGVFIATLHVLPIGTPVVLRFKLPSGNEPLAVSGTVQWVRGPNAMATSDNVFGGDAGGSPVKPGLGIRFTEVSPYAQRAIADFMTRRAPDFYA